MDVSSIFQPNRFPIEFLSAPRYRGIPDLKVDDLIDRFPAACAPGRFRQHPSRRRSGSFKKFRRSAAVSRVVLHFYSSRVSGAPTQSFCYPKS